MSNLTYFALCGVCVAAVLLGINMMSKVKTAVKGNGLAVTAMALAIGIVFFLRVWAAGISLAVAVVLALVAGAVVGIYSSAKAKMIAMPQIIALLNGLGGGASALVAAVTAVNGGAPLFESITASIALAIGALTLTGSLIAAGKLARILDARPKSLPCHSLIMAALAVLIMVGIVLQSISSGAWAILVSIASLAIGAVFVMRVGGADMPITISLLNALSGVAGGIAGMAINEPLLVAVGGIVGASGLILTQDMCKAMNRKLLTILSGNTTVTSAPAKTEAPAEEVTSHEPAKITEDAVGAVLQTAKRVIIVPGYGMALSQAQADVAALAAALEKKGAEVKFAIHPVAGRMPGHMSVLLCEADIDYDKLVMMEDINEEFASCDIAVVIGANDVTNPAANTAEGTPIYGMPVLNVEQAPMAVFCNFDEKPGYAGVPNPLYDADNVLLMLGDAKESVQKLLSYAERTEPTAPMAETVTEANKLTLDAAGQTLQCARKVIIVPGYGMALSQAQSDVARLANTLERRGAEVKFAIHPVAGRMPGHMSVLLCEADIDYDKLFMMEDINEEFASCDIAVVIGANDVTNPAANTAEGTPIYGMPVLSVEDAPVTVFCNFDEKPGYAGVPNPLYKADNVLLMLGDAKESVAQLQKFLS
jgi:NAD(P) transhydrogenase subunit beta